MVGGVVPVALLGPVDSYPPEFQRSLENDNDFTLFCLGFHAGLPPGL